MNTLIASGSGLLQAATMWTDSTDVEVFIARIEVHGHAGDSVVLGMAGEADLLDEIASRTEFVVRSGMVMQRYPASGALDGITILRLSEPAGQTIDIWLTRSLPRTTKAGPFELRLGGSATFSDMRTGWLERIAESGTASADLVDPTCDITSATGTCGGISWSVSPYVALGNGAYFTSRAGSGASVPVNITFSRPVASVTATIFDPTWSGSTIPAIGFDGSTIDQKAFSFSGIEHQSIPDSQSVSGVIERILLTPADADYVHYSASYVPLEAEIAVSCDTVERGQQATCTAMPNDAGASMALTGWQFRDADNNAILRTASIASTTWAGIVATSGIIRVNGTVNGVESFGVTALAVNARTWAGKVAPKEHTVIATTLSSTPAAMAELGNAALTLPTDPNVSGWLRTITDQGPNHDFYYLNEIPVVATSKTQVNTNAITDTSEFYRVQENRRKRIGGVWFCPKSLVTGDLFGLVQAHEGAVPDPSSLPNSHAGIYRRHIDSLAYFEFEGAVGFGAEDVVSDIRDSLLTWASNDAGAMDFDARNNITSTSMGCDTLRFTYSLP